MKTGLVLGGGGSKGAYEIGVWQATRELEIPIDVVTGTSIGALNGALVIQGDFDAAKKMWEAMSYESVMANVSASDLTTFEGARAVFRTALREIVAEGGMDITPLETLVRDMLDEEAVRRSPIAFGIVTVELPGLRAQELTKEAIPQGKMADYLLASSACYPAFKPREIDRVKYVDGGYKDNLPINLAIGLGAREILAVDLQSMGVIPKKRRFDVPVRYIRSYWDLGVFLTFDSNRIQRNIRIGYLDTMRSFNRYEGFAYTFEKGEWDGCYRRRARRAGALLTGLGVPLDQSRLNPFDSLLRHRLERVLRRGGRHKMNAVDFFVRAAEITGELLAVPPERVYGVEEFEECLLESFHQVEVHTLAEVEGLVKAAAQDAKAVTGLAGKIGKMETEQLLSLLYGWIEGTLKGENHNLLLAAAALPKEFTASFFLYLLKNPGQDC